MEKHFVFVTFILFLAIASTSLYSGTGMNVINVLDYGATPADNTDDTAAIQDAIDAASGGGMVFFPAGTYMVSSALIIDDNITLLGESFNKYTSIISFNLNGGTAIQSEDYPNKICKNIGIKWLSISATYGQMGSGIRLKCVNSCIEHVQIGNPNSVNGGILLNGSSFVALNFVILMGHSGPGTGGSGVGLYLDSCSNIYGFADVEGFAGGGLKLTSTKNCDILSRMELCGTNPAILLDNSNGNRIKSCFGNCSTRWLSCTGTSSYNTVEAYRNSDTGIPDNPILLDANTLYNIIYASDPIIANTSNYFSFGSSFHTP
jgi:hypothetical protein